MWQLARHFGFNTQPRGGGCKSAYNKYSFFKVSTHSRAEAAAKFFVNNYIQLRVSTHSRAEAAARTGCHFK